MPANSARPRKHLFSRQLAIGTLAGALCVLIGLGAQVLYERGQNEQLERATLQVESQAQLFEVFTRNLLSKFDQSLHILRAEIVEQEIPPDLSDWVAKRGLLRQEIFQLGVIDKDGRLAATTENNSNIGIDLSDREHFRIHIDSGEDRLFVSKPLIGRATKRYSLNLTRAIRNTDGTFRGVVVASVDPILFSNFLELLANEADTVVTLIGGDGIIRARSRLGLSELETIGTSVKEYALFRQIQARPVGTYRTLSRLDGIERIYAFRQLADVGLSVVAGVDIRAILVNASKRHQLFLFIASTGIIFVIGFAFLCDRYLKAAESLRLSQALAKDRERQNLDLSQIMDGCGALFVQTDASGRILHCNQSFSKLLGHKQRDDSPMVTIDSLVFKRGNNLEGDSFFAQISSCSEFPARFDLMTVAVDGTRRDLMWSWTKSVGNDDLEEQFIGVGIDNSELRAKEMMLIQSSNLASLGKLSRALNHELVQPLNVTRLALSNLVTEIKRGDRPEVLLARISRIVDHVQRAGRILGRYRALSSQGRDSSERLQISESIRSVAAMFAEQFRIDTINLKLEMDDDCVVQANRVEFEQVLVNLLANARDAILARNPVGFSEKANLPHLPHMIGKSVGTISIKAEEDRGSIPFVHLFVEDTGGGIPENIRGKIFQPFFTTKSGIGGTGLGLSISLATIEKMKGRLTVTNTELGARFAIALLSANEASAPAKESKAELNSRSVGVS